MCVKDKYVWFKNSELVCGNLGKKSLGTKNGLYYALIWDHSNEISAECMLWLSKFTSWWITNFGMSIGISDVTPSKVILDQKQVLIKEKYQKCDDIIDLYKQGKLALKAGCDIDTTLDHSLNG